MIFYLGDIVPDLVDDKLRKMRNKGKLWKYGYNEQIDTVVISKDGTLGEIYNINGLNIGFPEKPDHKEIINWDKTQPNQKWQREEMPAGLKPETENSAKYSDFIDTAYERRKNSIWIYIDGKPVYLARTYYFFLQWIREGNKYPNFRIIQNELMLYWEACKADERCFGICFVKPRRFGWSALGFTEMLEYGTSHENKLLGLMSKKGADAKKIFNRMVRSFKRLPFFFQPELDGNSTPKTELAFTEPSKKRAKGERITEGQGLDTSISWHNTEINAMDGDEIGRSLLDELGKFPKEVPADEYWSIVQTSHTIGSDIVGKSMAGSTVNAMKKGGAGFKSIYDDSNPSERQETGETRSGLYRLFISSKFCLAGFFDQYGFSIVEDPAEPMINDLGKIVKVGAKTYLKHKLEALKHKPEKYNERLRQFPDTDRDAFRDEASSSAFDLMKMMEQIDHNDNELNDQFDNIKNYYGNDMVIQGSLEWKDGIMDSEVVWKPSDEGRFFIRKDCHPPDSIKNKRVQKFKRETNSTSWTPVAEGSGCLGADPFNRNFNTDGRASMGAIHLCTSFNNIGLPNDTFILEYIARPRTVQMYFEDLLKAAVYFSMPILAEFSNEALQQYFVDRGYRNFLMNNPFKLFKDLTENEKYYGGAPAQDAKIADKQFYAIQAYIDDYVGIALDDSNRKLGDMGTMYFTRTLMQWKDFDPALARTKYDAYISSSLARLGCQRRVELAPPPPKGPIKIHWRTFNNQGAVSQAR